MVTRARALAVVLLGVLALAVFAAMGAPGCTRDDSSSPASFCEALRRAPSLATALTGFADQDPGRLTETLDDAAAAYDEVLASAPAEIEPDVENLVELVRAVIAAVREHSTDPEAAAAQIRSAMEDHGDAMQSGLAVADYALVRCNVEINPTVPEDTPEDESEATATTPATNQDGEAEGGL